MTHIFGHLCCYVTFLDKQDWKYTYELIICLADFHIVALCPTNKAGLAFIWCLLFCYFFNFFLSFCCLIINHLAQTCHFRLINTH